MGVVKLQFPPRGPAVEIDTPDVIVPALAKLSRCKDSIDVLQLTDELPDIVLPYLAWAASRKLDVPARHVRIVLKCCGDSYLERCLGTKRYRQLKQRYPVSEPFEPLH